MIITGCVDNTDTFWCSHDGRGYHLIIDEKVAREVNGTQFFLLAFCGANCSSKTYKKIGDLFFFNNNWVFDKHKMTLKDQGQDKIYQCQAVEER